MIMRTRFNTSSSLSGCAHSKCRLNIGLRVATNSGQASHRATGRSATRSLKLHSRA